MCMKWPSWGGGMASAVAVLYVHVAKGEVAVGDSKRYRFLMPDQLMLR